MDVMISDIINADVERREMILKALSNVVFYGDKGVLMTAMNEMKGDFTLCDLYLKLPLESRRSIITNVLTNLIEVGHEKTR